MNVAKTARVSIPLTVARFHECARPRSLSAKNFKLQMGLFAAAIALPIPTVPVVLASVSAVDMVGIVRESQKADPARQSKLERRSLTARKIGTAATGIGTGLMFAARYTDSGPLFKLAALVITAVGLLTLAVEKTVRMVMARSSVKELAKSIQSEEDKAQLRQAVEEQKLPEGLQKQLFTKLEKRGVEIKYERQSS